MKRLHSALPSIFACLLLLSTACGGDGDGPTGLANLPADLANDLAVTWFGTSLIVNGVDLIDDGTRVRLTFLADGTFNIEATRDLFAVFCDTEYDCGYSGDFTATPTEIVLDPGTEDEVTLSMTVTPTTLRLVGSDEGDTFDLSFVLPPLPDLIGTWVALNLFGSDGQNLGVGDALGSDSLTSLAVTFEADESFTWGSAFSPPDVFCELAVSCLDGGTYTVDADLGQIIFDPLEPDPTTMQVTVLHNSLTLSGQDAVGTSNWGLVRSHVSTPGEIGSWFALSLLVNGIDLTDPANGGTVQRLELHGSNYSIVTPQSPAGVVCGQAISPNCTSSGSYTRTIDRFDFTDDADATQTLNSLSMETTPITLRLFGTLGGLAVDFLYVRVF